MAGANSSTSSLTSTSHTLSNEPVMASALANSTASAKTTFLDSLEPTNRHVFLQPPASIATGSLQLAKETLDAFAASVSDEQQIRQREATKKRKRGDGQISSTDVLKIRKLHIDGFDTSQIWQQAKRIINSTLLQSQEVLRELEDQDEIATGNEVVPLGSDKYASEEDSGSASSDSQDVGSSLEDQSGSEEESDLEEDGLENTDDETSPQEQDIDHQGDLSGDEEEGSESDGSEEPVEELVTDPNGLNDGFFSIDQFNKQSQWFEDQDFRGDPNTDQVSDDEDFDWHADPTGPSFAKGPTRTDEDEAESDSEMEEELDGKRDKAMRDDMDFASEDGDMDDEGLLRDAQGLDEMEEVYYYKDFFAPPAGSRKNRKSKQSLRELPQRSGADVQRAMNDVRRDLFEDLSQHSDSEDALSEVSAGDPRSRRSAHERRQAKIAEEIRKLESELVAKRAWVLSGEAAAVDRPMNSLLEEDLEFEHVGKPVPVITEEVSESLEALIKRRILAQEFDEVLRRRPDALGDPAGARRGLVDVDTNKSRMGLGEELAEEHIKNANPDTYMSRNDEKLQREEVEIQNMWKDISGKLDALSSWHYKPKPVEPTLTVVSDVATISMEDAQPTTAQGVSGGESMIAPQELYKAGKETAAEGEVVSKSGLPVARQEMSREEKLRRRRREKERIRKAGGTDAKAGLGKKAQAQKETVSDLKKGGVMVINRQGEITNVSGKKPTPKAVTSSNNYKL